MARRIAASRRRAQGAGKRTGRAMGIGTMRRYELGGIACFAFGLIALCGLLGLNVGFVGIYAAKCLRYLFGIGSWVFSLLVMLIGLQCIIRHRGIRFSARALGLGGLFVSLLALYHDVVVPAGEEILPQSLLDGGGLFGGGLLFVIRHFFGMTGGVILVVALMVGSMLLATSWSLASGLMKMRQRAVSRLGRARNVLVSARKQAKGKAVPPSEPVSSVVDAPLLSDREEREWETRVEESDVMEGDVLPTTDMGQPGETGLAEELPGGSSAYALPRVEEILEAPQQEERSDIEQEIAQNAQALSRTLADFRVRAKIVHTFHGPAVTRYELEPAPGVKLSKFTSLADDLALSLAAPSVRIEPVAGKSAIGIEVPNWELEGVGLREVLEDEKFLGAKSLLTVGLGLDVSGRAIFADLREMPHLLVAGATGSGKSVCINALIASILFKARPDEVKFLFVDPKVVELSRYNGIPHMMAPVVTDMQEAASMLDWAVEEMEKRYAAFAKLGVREIASYRREMSGEEDMPFVVIVIDELADLMMAVPHDAEEAICRLAQKARAAGIHLVLATQRPSVDVITGTIKANIPSRIAFAVSSQIDSRIILDITGAEKLLGKGDMLFAPLGAPKPMRVQGAFVRDEEIKRLLDYLQKSSGGKEE